MEEHPGITLENAAALDEFALSAGAAADAAVRLEADQMEAAGATQSRDARPRQTWNASMITSARTTGRPDAAGDRQLHRQRQRDPPGEGVGDPGRTRTMRRSTTAQAAIDQAAADQTAAIIAEAETRRRPNGNCHRRPGTAPATIQARSLAPGASAPVGAVTGRPAMVPPDRDRCVDRRRRAGRRPAAPMPPIVVNVPAPAADHDQRCRPG